MKREPVSGRGKPLSHAPRQAVKLCGADIELGNFVLGLEHPAGTSARASSALLREIEGLPRNGASGTTSACGCPVCTARREAENSAASAGMIARAPAGAAANSGEAAVDAIPYGYFNPQDVGRKFLPANGGCIYIDLDHLELCIPEVISAYDHVACWHAMLRIARKAMADANAKLPAGQRIEVLVNNSDGFGHSYGSHLNFLLTRLAWEDIFHRKLYPMLFLAAYQVSSIVFTGQGKAGSENGAPDAAYQIAQRADFMETLTGVHTTFNRPIVNSRDESLCGKNLSGQVQNNEKEDFARLHVIFYDNTLCQTACLLKTGVMQIILAMIEAGETDVSLLLDDPVRAVVEYSHDPFLQKRARMSDGRELTAVELQLLFLDRAKAFVEKGRCNGTVPRAGEIVALWEDTLAKLAAADFDGLVPRLDWVLKFYILQKAAQEHPGDGLDGRAMKLLDHAYANLDEQEGLFWAFERAGVTEAVVDTDRITHFTQEPPEDTRAWTRAHLLRKGGAAVSSVDWDVLRFSRRGAWVKNVQTSARLHHPLLFTKTQMAPLFEGGGEIGEVLDALDRYTRGLERDRNERAPRGKRADPRETGQLPGGRNPKGEGAAAELIYSTTTNTTKH